MPRSMSKARPIARYHFALFDLAKRSKVGNKKTQNILSGSQIYCLGFDLISLSASCLNFGEIDPEMPKVVILSKVELAIPAGDGIPEYITVTAPFDNRNGHP